ncbi:hypothetical protein VSR01_36205 [Actinacidiphila sp. DG2A-62]|nr:hypothetical protein [Actinacidiphila sp. DG2A-62]MEC3998639.1 hypothetical protein [Actinacidiphila sp. DG2A-62]
MADPDDEGHSGWRIDQIAGTADGTRVQLWTCNGTGAAVDGPAHALT